MGILDKLEQRPMAAADAGFDNRYYRDEFGGVWGGGETFAGFPIDPDLAMRVSAVFACNSLISETLASLPCVLYRRLDDGGKERATDHRVYWTLRYRPNSWMTPLDFFGGGQMNAGMRGNGLAEIRDDGTTMELLPLQPKSTTVEQLDNGRLRYKIMDQRSTQPRYLLQERVLHVRDLSSDGIAGLSRSALAREAIAVAAAAEAFVGGWYKNDTTGRLLIKHPAALDETKRSQFRAMIQENYGGWANRAKAMLLTNGVTAEELGKHDDAGHLVDPRKFQVADIARFWRVPLFMIGMEEKSTSWGTGIESQMQGFVNFTIKPWADRWTQAMMRALLTEEEQDQYVIEFLFADLVRGDLLQRMQAYAIGKGIGMWSPDELRAKENEGPRDDGLGGEYQQTPTGAAPNVPAPGPGAPGGVGGPPDTQPGAVSSIALVPVLMEIAGRMKAIELRQEQSKVADDHPPTPASDAASSAVAPLVPVLMEIAGRLKAVELQQQQIQATLERPAPEAPVPPSASLPPAPPSTEQSESGTRRIAARLREQLDEREEQLNQALGALQPAVEALKSVVEQPPTPIELTVSPPAVTVHNHIKPAKPTTREVTITDEKGKVLRRGKIEEEL